MHEMSLAVNIVDIAVQTAEREGAQSISRIEVEVGTLAGVLVDSLEFCLGAAARGTKAENAVFEITPVKAQGKCSECENDFEVFSFHQHCPDCSGSNITISGGQQLKVAAVTIEEENTNV